MTRLQAIQVIGNIIQEVDTASGSLPLNDPNQERLEELRTQLDDCQRKLSEAVFDDNTQTFQDAANQLNTVNQQIRGTIKQVENIQTTLGNIERFLNAATSLVTLVGGLV
jgi:archaellum component FlaC